MALRSFQMPDGSVWNVWEVASDSLPGAYAIPRVRERRGQNVFRYTGPERRTAERRLAPARPSVLAPEYREGWLAFQCGGEKRRLAPPPRGWEALPDDRLAALCRRAVAASARRAEQAR